MIEIFRNKKVDVFRFKGKGREENWEEGWFREECLSNYSTVSALVSCYLGLFE